MTRKLKTLEHGKTKDPKNTKLDGKSAKLVEELKLLKAATKLGMVKKVFVFNQDPDKVLKLHKSTAEQRAICRLLINNPFLKEAVASSKKKLDIKDDDEEWKKMLFELGKNKAKKLRKEKFEEAAGIAPTTALEKKIAAKKAKNKEKKAKKKESSSLDAKSKTIDKSQKKEKSEQQKQQLLKPKKSKPVDNSPPKKVTLFPVEKPKEDKKPQKKDYGGFKKEAGNFNRDEKPKGRGDFQKPPAKAEKLHPSWEAKKQIKPTISEFKGKKITFDD